MSRKIVGGHKDENGIFIRVEPVPAPTPAPEPSADIDDLMKAGLQAIRGVMKAITADINTGLPSRETVQNLKDVLAMLKDLKKEEKEWLDALDEEQLKEMMKK